MILFYESTSNKILWTLSFHRGRRDKLKPFMRIFNANDTCFICENSCKGVRARA